SAPRCALCKFCSKRLDRVPSPATRQKWQTDRGGSAGCVVQISLDAGSLVGGELGGGVEPALGVEGQQLAVGFGRFVGAAGGVEQVAEAQVVGDAVGHALDDAALGGGGGGEVAHLGEDRRLPAVEPIARHAAE